MGIPNKHLKGCHQLSEKQKIKLRYIPVAKIRIGSQTGELRSVLSPCKGQKSRCVPFMGSENECDLYHSCFLEVDRKIFLWWY